jgi:xylulokinase
MSLYLALDIGTTSAKAALYEGDGRLIASQSADYALHQPQPGWAEQDPRAWWDATQTICQAVLREAHHPSIRAVAVSGQAPGCVPVDRQGRPLRPAILWLDRRATDEAHWLRDHLGQAEAERLSGNTLDSYFGGVKWLWFRRREPELYSQTAMIHQAASLVTFQLTGEAALDPSHAGMCSPCFNLAQRRWDERVCELMGLDPRALPPIRNSTDVVGGVTRAAAALTGIPADTPIVCGGGDFACACLGAGVIEPGAAAMMLGTAGNLLIPAPPRTDPRLINTGHVTGSSLSLGGVMAGGVVRWFGDMLRLDAPDLFGRLDAEAAQTPPGASGLIFLPYLMGERTPVWDAQARGVFIGLTTGHQRGHLFRAVLEGVALAFRQMLEIVSAGGADIHEIIAVNGGARSALWRQIFADLLGVPIRWRPTSGGTLLGSAYLAAVGSGDAPGFDALKNWLEPTLDLAPHPAHRAIYERQYEIFRELYGTLKHTFAQLNTV